MNNGSAYSQNVQEYLMIGIISSVMIMPVLMQKNLSPIVFFGPVAIIVGYYMITRMEIKFIPKWVVLNMVSGIVVWYSAYAVGTVLTPMLMVLLMGFMLVYDIASVKAGTMQAWSGSLLERGLPIMFMIPHSSTFRFEKFQEIIRNDGLEGLHDSNQGVMMLGIGDVIIPTALAISIFPAGRTMEFAIYTLTVPQLTTLAGGLMGLTLLIQSRLPRAVAALSAAVPGALIGLAIGYLLDPTAAFY